MRPIISIEFTTRAGDTEFREESINIHNPEEFAAFVAPGGSCESVPDSVDEIQIIFLPPEHPNTANPIADRFVTLEFGMIFFTGPLSEIVQTAELILDKAGRGELSESFLRVATTRQG